MPFSAQPRFFPAQPENAEMLLTQGFSGGKLMLKNKSEIKEEMTMLEKICRSAAAVLLSLTVFTGCFPSGEQLLPNMSDKEVAQNVSEQISEIASGNGHLTIDVELPESFPSEVPKLTLSVLEWDGDKLNELFLNGKTGLEHSEYPSDYFSDEVYHVYGNEDYWLVYEPARITSNLRNRQKEFGYLTAKSAMWTYDLGGYYTDDSVVLFPKSDAIDRVNAVLTELGIGNFVQTYAYAITADKANAVLSDNMRDSGDSPKGSDGDKGVSNYYKEWTESDEVYFLSYAQEYEGVPITMLNDATYIETKIDAVVSKDEIIALEGSNLFSPGDYEIGESVKINCTPQYALKTAAEYWDNLILGMQALAQQYYEEYGLDDYGMDKYDYKIFNCQLVYVDDKQIDEKHYTVIPAWRFDLSVDDHIDATPMNVLESVLINAHTGNMILPPKW